MCHFVILSAKQHNMHIANARNLIGNQMLIIIIALIQKTFEFILI